MKALKAHAKKRFKKQLAAAGVFVVIVGAGWVYPLIGYLVPLCMIIGIVSGIIKGRKWCDFYCPRGSFFDTACKPLSTQKKIPEYLRKMSFRIPVLLLLMAMMSLQIVRRWPDFMGIGSFFVLLLTVVSIAGIILSLVLHQRTWCSFCPVGTLANFSGRRSSLLIDSDLCNSCKLCAKICPVQIAPYEFKSEGICRVENKDCLLCGLCTEACPQKALQL